MKNKLLLIFLSSFIGISVNPEILMASDSVAVSGLSNAGIVETVLPPELELEPVKVLNYVTPTPTYVAPVNNIQVVGRTLEIVDVDSTKIDSGNHVNKYGNKFLYGHNSAGVFAGLYSMSEGSIFTVAYGGVTQDYQVVQVIVFEKNDGLLQLNREGNYMSAVARARHGGMNYDLSMMTCYGQLYGDGDASHRLVLFANAI